MLFSFRLQPGGSSGNKEFRVTSPTTDLTKPGVVSDLDPKRWLALVVIGIAQLMVVLDATIVNIALPQAAIALNISDANRQWIVTAYALPFGALLLLGGRIGDYLGRKKVLIVALAGFALASALGGIAQNFTMLAGARALQGVFAAMLAPAALSMLTVTFREPKERAKAFAVFGAIAGGGAAVGLVLGGLLTEYATWRWTLLVNIPIATIAIVGTITYLHESSMERTGHYDVLGALLATLGLGMLVWGFNQAASHGWSSVSTWGWLVVAVVLLVAFAVLESRNSSAILPMRILRDRNRAGAYLVGLLVGTGLFAVFLFLTFFLQSVKLWTPLQSGYAFLPFSAGVIIGAGVGSQLVLKVGAKIVVPAGLVLGTVGLLLLSRLTLESSYAGTILPAILLISVGMVHHQRCAARDQPGRFRSGQRHGQHHPADRWLPRHCTAEHVRSQRHDVVPDEPRQEPGRTRCRCHGQERSATCQRRRPTGGQRRQYPRLQRRLRLGGRVLRARRRSVRSADQRRQARGGVGRAQHGCGLTVPAPEQEVDGSGTIPGPSALSHQPRARQSRRCGRSAPRVVSSPCPG